MYAPPRSSGKRFYIVLGSVAAVLALLLIDFSGPFDDEEGGRRSGTIEVAVTEQGPTEGTAVAPRQRSRKRRGAAGAMVQPVQWY